MKSDAFVMFSPTEKLGFKILVVFGSYFPPRRGFMNPGHGKISYRSPKNKIKQEQNGDREQASNSERTEVKCGFSKLLKDGSQIRNYKHKSHNLK